MPVRERVLWLLRDPGVFYGTGRSSRTPLRTLSNSRQTVTGGVDPPIDSPPLYEAGMALADILPSGSSASSLSHTSMSGFQDSYGVDGNESPLDQAYFSRDFIHETEVAPMPTGRPTSARPHVQTSRTNNLSVIAMLQQQQTLFQRVLSSQESITQRQQEMDKEINIIKEKLEAGADSAVSTSSSSFSSTKKRKRTVSRTLSVSINIFITRIASIYSRERFIVFMNL